MIVSGELQAGERLNEQALTQQFVSRGPVREAMRSLERAQLVSARPNQGFFVREVSPAEIEEIYDVRAVVYGLVCQRLAVHISDEELACREECVSRMDAAIAANDPAAYYRLNLEYHEQSITYARHGCARQTCRALINETHLTRQRSLHTLERKKAANDEHKALIAALKARDAELARQLGEEHASPDATAGGQRSRHRVRPLPGSTEDPPPQPVGAPVIEWPSRRRGQAPDRMEEREQEEPWTRGRKRKWRNAE